MGVYSMIMAGTKHENKVRYQELGAAQILKPHLKQDYLAPMTSSVKQTGQDRKTSKRSFLYSDLKGRKI